MLTGFISTAALLLCLSPPVHSYRYYTLSSHEYKACDPQEGEVTLPLDSHLIHGSYMKYKMVITPQETERPMCTFKVKPPTGYGVLATLQWMSLASDKNGTCLDFVQFLDGPKIISKPLCGDNKIGSVSGDYPWWANTFNTPGTMKVNLMSLGMASHGQKRRLFHVEIVFVAYKECTNYLGNDWQRCFGTDLCLRSSMFCDGIVSCPGTHSGPTDEFLCGPSNSPDQSTSDTSTTPNILTSNKYTMPEEVPTPRSESDGQTVILLVVLIVILIIFAICLCGTIGKKKPSPVGLRNIEEASYVPAVPRETTRPRTQAETIIPAASLQVVLPPEPSAPEPLPSSSPPEYQQVILPPENESLPPPYESLFPS